jgi:hypothetical protein
VESLLILRRAKSRRFNIKFGTTQLTFEKEIKTETFLQRNKKQLHYSTLFLGDMKQQAGYPAAHHYHWPDEEATKALALPWYHIAG